MSLSALPVRCSVSGLRHARRPDVLAVRHMHRPARQLYVRVPRELHRREQPIRRLHVHRYASHLWCTPGGVHLNAAQERSIQSAARLGAAWPGTCASGICPIDHHQHTKIANMLTKEKPKGLVELPLYLIF